MKGIINQPGNAGVIDGSYKKIHGQNVSEQDANASKRIAQQGQWRTPPLPAFASHSHVPAPSSAAVGTIPTTPDEYARMLQEAYKKGAEAGARAQQPTQHSTALPVQYMAPPSSAAPGVVVETTSQPRSVPVKKISYAPGVVSTGAVTKPPPSSVSVSRSRSLPDMSSYQVSLSHADDEEDKRKKRLARNRASARLRRLKKKNLVDSYEGEVGILESALSKLRLHRWGSATSDHEALIEALSMERGQQPLTSSKRRELVQSIVNQQSEQVANLLDNQLENWILLALGESGGTAVESDGPGTTKSSHEEELSKATSELQSLLQLTPQQLELIKNSSQGCAHEIQDLFTVENCLKSIHSNQWLLDEGVDGVAAQYTSVLNPAQLSKFLLWSDHNAYQIEKLNCVNVLAGVESEPVFEFGFDEGLADGD